MKLNKLLLVSIILLTILTFGAVSAAEDTAVDDLTVVDDGGSVEIASSVDEIDVGGEIAVDASSSDVANISDNAADDDANDNLNTNSMLGASDDGALGAEDNVVTPENFADFFDEDGFLQDSVTTNELIFSGNFESPVDAINILKPVTITGDNAVLTNLPIYITCDDVSLNDLTFVADETIGFLIDVEGSNVVLTNLDISYDSPDDDESVAVNIHDCGDVCLLNSNVFFESHVSDDTKVSVAVQVVNTQNVVIDGNNITAKLPCVYVNTYDEDYYLMGSNNVNPVRLKDCSNLVLTNNNINSTTNDYSADFPTIQSIYIIGCTDSLIDHNNISMVDEMTPEGMDNYLYGIDFGHNYNVTFSHNNFIMFTRGGQDQHGTAYAFQGVESTVNIVGNNITSISNGPNLGIYVASMFGGDSKLYIADNFINVTGSASSSGTWALVSGIEIQNGDAQIYNNTVYTYNVNEYEDGAYMYGISYAQWMYGDRSFDIQNNTVYTEGKYAISVIDATSLNVEGNVLCAHNLTGDDAINPGTCEDVNIDNNSDGTDVSTNVVTQDNFYDFFDDSGLLLDSVAYDELIFQGSFSDLAAGYVILTRPITITGDEAVLNNMGIVVSASDVSLNDLTFNADVALGDLVNVGGSNVNLNNLNIIYIVDDEAARAISIIDSSDVNVENASIAFESHVTDSGTDACAINIEESENVVVTGSEISTSLPALYVNYASATTQFMGLDQANPIRIMGSNKVNITRNAINSQTNDYSQEYATIQAILVVDTIDCLIDSNNIALTDEFAQEGQDIYLYGISFAYDEGLVMSNNNFTIYTEGGKEAAGTAYAIQGIESELSIIGNNITTFSNGPNLGIYVTSMAGENSVMLIENNFINVTGLAAAENNWALVSGIEIQNGDSQVYNNTIYTYNVDEYNENDFLSGISYIQWMYGGRTFDIQNNTVYTEGKYAIYLLDASNSIITGNTLYAHNLTGSDAVFIQNGDNNLVDDNLPRNELTNVVTQDNFHSFFDDSGNLLNAITFDELIFQGEFDDLVNYITIDRPIIITGDDAVLNDIAFIIASSDVTLDNLTLVANSDLGNLIDIASENVVISNNNISYVVTEAANAINVYPGANNVQILNNSIYFESTVEEYTVDDTTNAICVNSGVSIFDDEDPITGLVIDGNNITAVIPAFLADLYEQEYYVMGISAVNGVRINGAEDFEFTDNNLDVTTNRLDRTTPTYQAIYVASSSGLVDGNNITMIDTFTPVGKDVYIDAMVLIYDEDLTISNNNFNISTTGGKDEAGSAYAVVGIASEFSMDKNNITTVSNGPNLAVYFPSNMGEPCDVVMTGNFINVTGLATSAHDTGLVSGVEVQTGSIEMSGNTIYTYNIGDYDEDNYIFGISYVQDGVNSELEIINNTIYTEGHYAVSLKSANDAVITDNYFVSTDLMGDDAVYIGSGSGNIVEDNLPVRPSANITVTADAVWIGSNATVSVNVPNATGTVTIEINGKSYSVELDNGVATKEISDEDLIAGENLITATYEGPEFPTSNNTGVLQVLDGVVTQDNYMYYFNQADAGKFFDYVPEGVTLDFQGSIINPDQNVKIWFNVNKPVNIVSTTNDAYIDLNTTAGSLSGDNPGNRFTVGYDGSGSNITGINFHNTQLWIANTHHVVLDNISNVVEDQRVGSGVGATSVRENCTYVTVKNSYFYTRNNGGSSSLVMAWADYCTFDNNTIVVEGNVGNMIYLTTFNVNVPSGVTANVYNNITNNRIKGPATAAAICWGLVISGANNLVENNTIDYKGTGITVQSGTSVSPNNTYRNNVIVNGGSMNILPDSIAYNNTVSGTFTVGARAVVYNNTFGGKLTVSGVNAVVENNTVAGAVTISGAGVTFVGNNVSNTVTVNSNNNVLKENNIITTGNYAVDLKTKTGNTVTDNYLIASELEGDAAVKFSGSNVVEHNYPRVCDNITVVATDVFEGQATTITVTVPGATGNVTIRVNGREEIVDLVDGVAVWQTAEYGDNLTVNVTYNGDARLYPNSNSTTFNIMGNVVTNDTFYNYFDETGFLKNEVPYDELIFQGEFSNLAAGYIIISKSVTITGDNAVLNDLGVVISSEYVALDNLTLVATTSLGDLISVTSSRVILSNLNISYTVDDEMANAISVSGTDTISDVYIMDSNIYFESHVTSDEELTTAINLDDVEEVFVDGNNITANIPSLYVATYDWTYFMMGLCYVNPIRVYEADTVELTNNNIGVTVNSYDASYPTVQALYIVGSNDVMVKGNNVTMVDNLTPAGTPIYLYAVECGFSSGIEFIENNFNISTTGGKSGAGSAYALQVATSDATFIGNNITCESNGPNLGIYSPYGFGPAKDLVIKDNFINVTGYATGSNDFALVSGIEIQTGYATIYNNTIYVQNKAGYADNYPVSGISAIQYSAKTLSFDIQDNTIYADGKYTVEMRYPPQGANVTENYLIAHELKGDDSVYIKSGNNNLVENNRPYKLIINVSVDDVVYPEDVIVKVNATVDGDYTVDINGTVYTVTANGDGLSIKLAQGFYYANITGDYSNDDYYVVTENTTFAVEKGVNNIEVIVEDTTLPGDVVVNVVADVDDVYNVIVGDYSVEVVVEDGEGSAAVAIPAGENYIATVIWENENYTANVTDAEFNVVKGVPTFNVTANSIVYGKNLTVKVHSDDDFAYRVNVTVGDQSVLLRLKDGNRSAKFSGLEAGNYTVLVVYKGDDNYEAASANVTVEVAKAVTNIKIIGNEPSYGEDLVVNVTLNDDTDSQVVVTLGDMSEVVNLVDGHGSAVFAGLAAGSHEVSVAFDGDNNYQPKTLSAHLHVLKAAPMNFTVSADDVAYGEDLVVTVTSSDTFAYRINVTVGDQTKLLRLKDGKGTVKFSDLAAGTYDVVAVYKGDENYTSASAETTAEVVKATPDNLKVTAKVITGGDLVVDVSMDDEVAYRINVTVGDQSKLLRLKDGKGTLTFSGLEAGNYTVVALYKGDANYLAVSAETAVEIKPLPKNLTITADAITYGDDLIVNVSLDDEIDYRINVTVGDQSKLLRLKDGKGTLKFSGLAVGNYTIVAVYKGDSSHSSIAVEAAVEVAKATPNLTVSAKNSGRYVVVDVNLPDEVDYRVNVTVGNESQLLRIKDGQGTAKFKDLEAGTYTVTATYKGDNNYLPVSVDTTVEVK